MALILTPGKDAVTATLEGDLTIFAAEELQDELLGLLNHQKAVLSLKEVTEVDGCGIQLLLILKAEADRAGKSLTLLSGNAAVDDAWRLLGLPPLPSGEEEA